TDPGDRAERKAAAAEEAHDDVREIGGDEGAHRHDERAALDPAGDGLLPRAHQLFRGGLKRRQKPPAYEPLFVDEAQDLAPIDLAVLLDAVRAPNGNRALRSVTLAGDTAQRLHIDSGFRDWREVLGELGLARIEIEPLRIAYRSTREVLVFA